MYCSFFFLYCITGAPITSPQARETLCVIMERQRKQREDMIVQVQRYMYVRTVGSEHTLITGTAALSF